jgi:methionyl aminopeptidase
MVFLRQPEEIEKLRASNAVVAEILRALQEKVKAGITTIELDRYAEEMARKRARNRPLKGIEATAMRCVFP